MSIELAYFRGEWDRGISIGNKAIALARSLNQRTLLPRLSGLDLTDPPGTRTDRRGEESCWTRRSRFRVSTAPTSAVDVHQVVPVYIGWAYYLVGLGDYYEAIEMAQRGPRYRRRDRIHTLDHAPAAAHPG